jgi:membrane associated rhomboid family serine protease
MVEQQQQRNEPDRTWGTRRQRAGIAAFITGLAATLAFFAFFPGLPHVIDWGAIVVGLVVGALARWFCQSRMTKATQKRSALRAAADQEQGGGDDGAG